MRKILLSHLTIALVLASASNAEFQVNTRTSYDQKDAAIAMDAEGNFVVVWSSYFRETGRSNDIFSRLFRADGSPTGSEFQANATTPGNQTESSVAMNAAGNFVVAWQGPGSSQEDIFARRFDPNGQPLGDEFLVNSFTTNRQRCPKVAINVAGNFVIVWESERLTEQTINWVTSCQLFDANSLPIGEEFQANLLTDCRYPDVAMDDNGNFAIIWMQEKSSNSIIARMYNADGTAKTEPFDVSTIKFSSLTRPSIAMASDGHFVVTWDGDPKLASLDDVHARLFEPNGAPIGEQFVVNTTRIAAQQNPKAAMNNQGEFVIVWESNVDPNTNERDIFGQRYDSLGQPIGNEFQLNIFVEGDQRNPDIALSENGVFVTVWQSDSQDSSGFGIFGTTGSIVGSADLNFDGFVNFKDFCILASQWQQKDNSPTADLIDDNKIDERDLAAFCNQWLTTP